MKKLIINIFYSSLSEILLFSFSFILGVLTARYLGAAGKGKFWLVYNIAGFLSVIFSARIQRSLTYHLSREKEKKGGIIIAGLLCCFLTTGCVYLFVTVFSNLVYNYLLKNFYIHISLLVLIALSHNLWLLIVSIIEGFMRFKLKAAFFAGSYFLKCFLVIVGLGYLELSFARLILLLGSVETIFYLLVVCLILLRTKIKIISIKETICLIRYSAASFPGLISDMVTLRIDTFFVNYFVGLAEVGVYTVAVSLVHILLYFPVAIRNVLLPYIAGEKERNVTPELCRHMILIVIMIAIIFLPLAWIAIVPIYGKEFELGKILVAVLIPGTIFYSIFAVLSSDLEGRGRPGVVSLISLIVAVITILLDWLVIPVFKSTGAAAVSTVTYFLTMVLIIMAYKKISGIEWSSVIIVRANDVKNLSGILYRITGMSKRATPAN